MNKINETIKLKDFKRMQKKKNYNYKFKLPWNKSSNLNFLEIKLKNVLTC